MAFVTELEGAMRTVSGMTGAVQDLATRLKAQCEFASGLAKANPDKQARWEKLILKALAGFAEAIAKGHSPKRALLDAEELLKPLARTAKAYTVHCVGHAHIDMNWMWNWPETVAITNDTFSTVDRLMEEFPEFKFSQSQISVYLLLKDLAPELYERVRRRIAEGRWEITASQWVEGDKNMASGEILCRHLLHARRFLKEEFGLPFDAVKIDWECDTFGHAHTVPTILAKGGVTRYYFHRTGPGPWLFWWQGTDGSRLLAFDDGKRGYNGAINEKTVLRHLFEYSEQSGMKDFMLVYGVGDHGGGPTRADIVNARLLDTWPIFPNVRLSTTDAFFNAIEPHAGKLPVIDAEMNTVFEGCYTSQSDIKQANRVSESALVEAEICALLAHGLAGKSYPEKRLTDAWRRAMFNQFHDILPGSNTPDSRHYALANFQEILARTTMIKTQSLRKLASMIDTASCCACRALAGGGVGPNIGQGAGVSDPVLGATLLSGGFCNDPFIIYHPDPAKRNEAQGPGVGHNIGQGAGEILRHGLVSRVAAGGLCCDPFIVFNPNPWKRTEVVSALVWDREHPDDKIVVTDETGKTVPAQFVRKGKGWGSGFTEIAFPVADVAGVGWRTFAVARAAEPPKAEALCKGNGKGGIENEFFKVEVDEKSGALIHLVDKRTGLDFVAPSGRIGLVEYVHEAPHGMTAWVIGQIIKTAPLVEGIMDTPLNGPYLATVRVRHKVKDSTVSLLVSLAAGVPRVDFELVAEWVERGHKDFGVPGLRVSFDLAVAADLASFECPNGSVKRPTDPAKATTETMKYSGWYFAKDTAAARVPAEVPSQKWAALAGSHLPSGKKASATILNDSKYGCRVDGNVFRLNLLRSTYDPDALPEMGTHTVRFSVVPGVGEWSASDATRAGVAFNMPLNVVSTTRQEGTLPARSGFAEILTANVMLSGLKKAEDSNALIVRLYEMEGKATVAKLKLDEAFAPGDGFAVECDVMETPLAESAAKMKAGVLSVKIPAFGMVTVKIG